MRGWGQELVGKCIVPGNRLSTVSVLFLLLRISLQTQMQDNNRSGTRFQWTQQPQPQSKEEETSLSQPVMPFTGVAVTVRLLPVIAQRALTEKRLAAQRGTAGGGGGGMRSHHRNDDRLMSELLASGSTNLINSPIACFRCLIISPTHPSCRPSG